MTRRIETPVPGGIGDYAAVYLAALDGEGRALARYTTARSRCARPRFRRVGRRVTTGRVPPLRSLWPSAPRLRRIRRTSKVVPGSPFEEARRHSVLRERVQVGCV